jgi:hypothetical protein
MTKLMALLFAFLVSVSFLLAPSILEARGGFGGGFHGGGFHGGGFGGHGGGFHGGFHGRSFQHGHFFGHAPFFGFGAGFLGGYWSNGYYYTYPYYGACQRWVPTGSYRLETRQDPNTGNLYNVQVPDGYWEVVPCY